MSIGGPLEFPVIPVLFLVSFQVLSSFSLASLAILVVNQQTLPKTGSFQSLQFGPVYKKRRQSESRPAP